MKNRIFNYLVASLFSLGLLLPQANAALITDTEGNGPGVTGFADGDLLGFPQFGMFPAPEIGAGTNGADPTEDFSRTWSHVFGPIADPILSAQLTLGIYDHDSASPDSQLASLMLDGNDFTTTLDGLFEGHGGANSEYNVYSFDLSSIIASLTDGNLLAALDLKGPVESPGLLPTFPNQIDPFNGATLIFSSLEITTQDGGGNQIPEPGALWLLSLGALLLTLVKKTQAK